MRFTVKHICASIIFFISVVYGQNPNWEWAITSSGSFPYNCLSSITDDGEIFLAGSFWGEFSTPLGDLSEENQSIRPIYFAKLSSSGNWEWANRAEITIDENMGYNAFCDLNPELAVDQNRNLYFIVNANGYADYSFGGYTVAGGTNRDLIVKVNQDGIVQWVKALNETPNQTNPKYTENVASINAIAADRNSDIIIAGSCWGQFSIDSDTADYEVRPSTTAFYAKLDQYGKVQWIKTGKTPTTENPGHFAEINDIEIDNSNNYYFSGNYDYAINFGEGNEFIGTTGDFIINTSTSGDVSWIFGTVGGTKALLTTNTLPSVYVSTKFYADFEIENEIISKPGEMVSCIFNLSKSGQFRWYKEIEQSGSGTVNVSDMDNSEQGNVLIAGNYGGTLSYEGTSITSTGLGDSFIMSINEEGYLNWIKSFGGTGNDDCNSVSRNDYNICTSGAFDLTSYFDDISITMPDGDYDLYVAKLGPTTSARSETKIDYTFSLSQNYPNPFNPSTSISYSLPQSGNVKIAIYDILAREVKVLVDEYKSAGNYNIDFDASKLSSGTYFYKLESNGNIEVKKMMLIK